MWFNHFFIVAQTLLFPTNRQILDALRVEIKTLLLYRHTLCARKASMVEPVSAFSISLNEVVFFHSPITNMVVVDVVYIHIKFKAIVQQTVLNYQLS